MSITNPMTKGYYQGLKPLLVNGVQVGMVPNVGGKVTFYAAGTTNAETVYTDPGLTVPYPSPSNVVNLNSQGWAIIYLAAKNYKYVESDSDNNPIFVQDNFQGGGGFGTGFAASIADLKAIDTNLNRFTYVAGYYTPGDGGEGMFYNATSNTPDDGGYVIRSTFDPTKDWFRIPDENGDVRAASFGFIPASTGDQTAKLTAADAYAASINARLLIQSGGAVTVTSTSFISPYVSHAPNGSFNSSATLTFSGIYEANNEQKFGSAVTVVFSPSQIAIPEWFGATLVSADNSAAFTKLWDSGAGGFKINPGTWTCALTVPPINKRILSFGIVISESLPLIPIGEYYFTAKNATIDGPLAVVGNITGLANVSVTGDVEGSTLTIHGNGILEGDLEAEGSITADGDINGSNIGASGNVISNGHIISDTYVRAKAGTSSNSFKAGGQLAAIVGASTGTIQANTMTATGDRLVITALGTANSGAAGDINITGSSFGTGAVVVSLNLPEDSSYYRAVYEIIRTGTTTATATLSVWCNQPTDSLDGRSINGFVAVNVTAVDWTTSKTASIAVVATGSGGASAQKTLTIEFYPA